MYSLDESTIGRWNKEYGSNVLDGLTLGKVPLNLFIASLVSLIAPILWVGTLLGLPGNWGLAALALALWWFVADSLQVQIQSPTIAAILFLAIVGEVVEFFAGAAGAKQLGGSRRGSALAILGSIVGALAGLFIGVPVPVVGSVLAALLFGGLGAFGGAVAGERWCGKAWRESLLIGWGAFKGKMLGILLKSICGTVMMALLLFAVWT